MNKILKYSADVWATIHRNSAAECYSSVRSTPKFKHSTDFIMWIETGAK